LNEKNQRSPHELIGNENSLEILGTLEFDATWPSTLFFTFFQEKITSNKMDQRFEFLLKVEFDLVSR
jgi:hypothetical protein